MTSGAPWFENAFGPLYTEIYQHRTTEEADGAIAALLERGHLEPPVLDIACGPGRHLASLAKRGRAAFGIDLSCHLLREALERDGPRVVRGDMRALPFRDGAFGSAISMFTSFGYFADAAENARVLEEAGRVLRPGGVLAVDYFNPVRTLADLTPESSRFVGRYDVIERRRIDESGRRLVKTIDVYEGERLIDELREEVTIYHPGELEALVRKAGFTDLESLGDYEGGSYDPERSPRLIVLARRPS